MNVSRGAVEDVKKKLNRKSRNLEEELMELLEAEKSRQMAVEEGGKRRAEPEAVQGGYSIAYNQTLICAIVLSFYTKIQKFENSY